MYDKIHDKIHKINEVRDIFIKINCKLKENVSYINSILNDSLLFDDSQLKYNINAKIYDTLNFTWYEIYRKNRIGSNEVNTDKLELLEKMYDSTHDIICEVKGKMLNIIINTLELYEKDMDKVHLIHSELKELMIKLKQDLKNIFNKEDLEYKQNNSVTRLWEGMLTSKIA